MKVETRWFFYHGKRKLILKYKIAPYSTRDKRCLQDRYIVYLNFSLVKDLADNCKILQGFNNIVELGGGGACRKKETSKVFAF